MGMQVVHEEFGIVEGLMTTVHATTGFLSLMNFVIVKDGDCQFFSLLISCCSLVITDLLSYIQPPRRLSMALQ